MFNEFEKIAENDVCEFGHYGMSKGITEHAQELKEGHFCIVSRNKKTAAMDFILFDKEQNILKESKNSETLLFFIDGLLINKYGNAKPHLSDYRVHDGYTK